MPKIIKKYANFFKVTHRILSTLFSGHGVYVNVIYRVHGLMLCVHGVREIYARQSLAYALL